MCSASWSVIEVNGVQCFTSSSLSFSIEQLSSKRNEKKIIAGVILFHLRLSTLERLRMFVVLHCIVDGVLSGGLTGGVDVCRSEINSLVNLSMYQ